MTSVGKIWADGVNTTPNVLNMWGYQGTTGQQVNPLMEVGEGASIVLTCISTARGSEALETGMVWQLHTSVYLLGLPVIVHCAGRCGQGPD